MTLCAYCSVSCCAVSSVRFLMLSVICMTDVADRFGLGSYPLTAAAVAAAGWLGSGHGSYWSSKQHSHASAIYSPSAADPTFARPAAVSRHTYHDLHQYYA